MSRVKMDYQTLLARHPKEVSEAVAALRASKSKHKASNPATMDWYYETSMQVNSYTFPQLLGKVPQPPPIVDPYFVYVAVYPTKISKYCNNSRISQYNKILPPECQ